MTTNFCWFYQWLVAQPGGLTLGFALDLVFLYCVSVAKISLIQLEQNSRGVLATAVALCRVRPRQCLAC